MALVLVVDDDADIRELIQINLESAGFRVSTAGNGREALEAVREEAPDAVFLDVMMPGVDGWTVLEELKSGTSADFSAIPVFMVSAMRGVEHRVKGGIEGALRYITKPFNPSDLVAALRDVLGPGAPAESELRRQARTEALEELARHESGVPEEGEPTPDGAAPRVRLTRLEHTPSAPASSPRLRLARERLSELTDKQLLLLEALAGGSPVTTVARHLEMSRSNVYAGLRRISRKLGFTGTDELLGVLRSGGLVESRSGGPR
ncbi:MAG: response regulator [Acidimicrobiia bacterium]